MAVVDSLYNIILSTRRSNKPRGVLCVFGLMHEDIRYMRAFQQCKYEINVNIVNMVLSCLVILYSYLVRGVKGGKEYVICCVDLC